MFPIRHTNHVIDTRAVRKVISQLDENWLIRGLEERDYGVDLAFEIFRDQLPTGETGLIQVKGAKKSFKKSANLSFPTKTIEYALLFPQPFFVFHVSLKDNSIRYVWLQRYARLILDANDKGWREQKTVTIKFPEENNFKDGQRKIEGFLKQSICRDEAIKVKFTLDEIYQIWHHQKAFINQCSIEFIESRLEELEQCSRFWKEYPLTNAKFSHAKKDLSDMKSNAISFNGADQDQLEYANTDHMKSFDKFLTEIQAAYQVFTEHAVGDAFFDESLGHFPY
ncbi:DUF4365 domain-containing protein [Leisingera daeponensis]|uniref:DUF4365 domain-containing protein n=1 Tax=Leisingera daeponensis TaxID=405746 RepID=A0ABS7NLQ8_9RHOB|nr:DUF4365 domain-containing protein [Leisingera daeponensis]MBY6142133.1 DUF4365 domain-containing protein [Leisingera daeponensis]